MKLIMEHWRKYLTEAEARPAVLDKTQIKALQDFVKSISALAMAAEASADEKEVPNPSPSQDVEQVAAAVGQGIEEGSAVRKGRLAKKSRQRQTATIKKMAGLSGVKLTNFTPEQRQLYDEAKEQLKSQQEGAEMAFLSQLTQGDLMEIPILKQLIGDAAPALKLAIAALLQDTCAVEGLSLYCIASALSGPT